MAPFGEATLPVPETEAPIAGTERSDARSCPRPFQIQSHRRSSGLEVGGVDRAAAEGKLAADRTPPRELDAEFCRYRLSFSE